MAKKCVYCKEKFSKDLDHCPHCGNKEVKEGDPLPYDVLLYHASNIGRPMELLPIIDMKMNYLEKEVAEIKTKLDKILEKLN